MNNMRSFVAIHVCIDHIESIMKCTIMKLVLKWHELSMVGAYISVKVEMRELNIEHGG